MRHVLFALHFQARHLQRAEPDRRRIAQAGQHKAHRGIALFVGQHQFRADKFIGAHVNQPGALLGVQPGVGVAIVKPGIAQGVNMAIQDGGQVP